MPRKDALHRRTKRIALLLAYSHKESRAYALGIFHYARPGRPWAIRTTNPTLEGLAIAGTWKPRGIIAQATSPAMIEHLQKMHVPVVNLSGRVAGQPFAQVLPDNPAIGRMAADYFLAKGYRHFAYFGDPQSETSRLREEGFGRRIAEAGFAVIVRQIREGEGVYRHWERALGKLEEWVQSLPKPTAVFVFDDTHALLLSEVCMSAAVAVPEQVALLGVADDELACNQSYPPLSSIQTAQEQIGYKAAELLDRMMSGKRGPDGPILVAPVGVVTRASTDIMAIADPEVAAAVRFLNEHLSERINVANVVDAVAVSRRVLEARFRKVMNRTILDELHRVRVERAKALLLRGTDSVPKIARECGFRDKFHLWWVFRKLTKMSPAAYRRGQGGPDEPEAPDAPDAADAPE